ncbi:MAG: radical SAM protein [Fidelibacterota bacterium]
MGKCKSCGDRSPLITEALEVCCKCIRENFSGVEEIVREKHSKSRRYFSLLEKPPVNENGVACKVCVNDCRIPLNGTGFCGIRKNVGGKISPQKDGFLDWYYDSLPTNCVASWVCAGCSTSGYPEYSYSKKPEYGYKNLAVFFRACSFDCLFCQNWHFRTGPGNNISPGDLAARVDSRTSCICYFGGDPGPQVIFAIRASKLAIPRNKIVRICWETNGSVNKKFLKRMAELSMKTGGCIKFDLKTYNEYLNLALCGVTNARTLENFSYLASLFDRRKDPPFLIASTLLIPGYIDVEEVRSIARFIADLNPEIPYSLLGFYPTFEINDLPTTSKSHAYKAYEAAKAEGLRNVHIGNRHLLSSRD